MKHFVKHFALRATLLALVIFALAACVAPVAAPAAGDTATTSTESDAAAGTGETILVTHAQGETEVPVNPQRVVIFDYSILDSADALGASIVGVPQGTVIPEFLSKYADASAYANVGTLFEPDFEKINQLQPDLIIVATRSAAQLPELAKIAPTIDLTTVQADWLNSWTANQTILGEIFGKQDEVAAVIAEVNETIERIKTEAAAAGKNALIIMPMGGKLTAHGIGSRFGIIHDVLGVPAAAENVAIEAHGDNISYEFVLETNPDIIYVIDRDAATGESVTPAEVVLDNELIDATTAAQNGDIYYMTPTAWYLAPTGLRTVPQMLAEVEEPFVQ